MQPTNISRKAREFANREQEILRVALDSFSGENWESVTVANIADSVGIAKGTMYLHFSGKHEIYARLTLDFYRSLLDRLTKCAKEISDDPFSDMVEQAFLFYLEEPKYRCVTQYCEREDFRRNLSPGLAQEFAIIDQAFHQLIHSELQRGIDSGRYKPVKIEQAILGLLCTFHGALTLLWCNRHGEQDNAYTFINNITEYMVTPLLAHKNRGDHDALDTTSPSRINDKKQTLETSHE